MKTFTMVLRKSFLACCTLLLASAISSNAQPLCTKTGSLPINTGYDPIAGVPIPVTTIDPKWTITAMSADALANCGSCGSALPYDAYAVPPMSGGGAYFWITGPASQWIGFRSLAGSGWDGYPTTGAGSYSVTFTREFKMCDPGDILFDLQLASDNYISSINIDGPGTTIYSAAPTNSPSSYNTFTHIAPTVPLSAGIHHINITVINYPEPNCLNDHGLNVAGNLVSSAGVLISDASPAGCVCGGGGHLPMPCDGTVSLAATFTATLNPNNDCQFTCTATTTGGSGWTPVSYTYTTPAVPGATSPYPGLSITNTSSAFTNSAVIYTPNGSGHVIVTVTVHFTNAYGDSCVVTATRSLDCNGGHGFVYRKIQTTGLSTHEGGISGTFTLYPNPTNSTVTIATPAGDAINDVEVMDITGHKMAVYHYTNNSKVTVSLEKYPAGTYTIRINGKENRLVTKTD